GAIESARAAPHQPLLIAAARPLAHRLRGTAGSYGFFDVGDACGRIEDALERLEGGAPPAPAGTWVEIERALADAWRSAGRPAPTAGTRDAAMQQTAPAAPA